MINKSIICVLWWVFMCIYSGREISYKINKENRNPCGKPVFVNISSQWICLFKHQDSMYNKNYKILKSSVIIVMLGYFFSIIEMVLLIISLFYPVIQCCVLGLSTRIFIFYAILVSFGIVIPNNIRYEFYMRKAYDYDWVTYLQEGIGIYPKRSCKIVSILDEYTGEICVGVFCKRIYKAKLKYPVNIGDRLYAVHIFGNESPYWIVILE